MGIICARVLILPDEMILIVPELTSLIASHESDTVESLDDEDSECWGSAKCFLELFTLSSSMGNLHDAL